jgi:hypothetical protein
MLAVILLIAPHVALKPILANQALAVLAVHAVRLVVLHAVRLVVLHVVLHVAFLAVPRVV